ncbi:MAG TPA: M1 family aminopeptidase [Terriglobales bacterium]|jgi:hypothetical protein|nr:M1 family aminopeptidase [Terriglobales bacterium]
MAALCQSPPEKPAESLYLQLRSVALDPERVYRVRDVSIDRTAIHITLEDGTLAFTKDVAGHVTGAFFEGEGEILLAPPNQVERSSMALLTGAAILEERFVTGYFRFNDDTYGELKPSLRPAENGKEFVGEWNETAQNLANIDALRLLMTFSRELPASDGVQAATHPERMWHARLQGVRLGPFDAYYDSDAFEQVWAGQTRQVENENFYDMWTSFSLLPPGKPTSLVSSAGKMDAISIPNYKIRSSIKLPKGLSAEAWLQMEVHEGGQRAVLFELSRYLNLKSVEADGKPIEFIHNQAVEGTQLSRSGNDLVAAIFPRALRSGEKIELHFVYSGDVLSEAGGGLLYVGARGTWFPNRRLAMSNYDLEFQYPVGWTLVATGKRVNEPSTKQGEQSARWVSERPMPLAGFNLGKYKSVSAHAGDTVVEAYAATGVEEVFPRSTMEVSSPAPNLPPNLRLRDQTMRVPLPPPSPARNAQSVADLSARAIAYYSRLFGPYPYSSLSLTQQPGAVNQGWPGLIFLSSFSFLSEADKMQLNVSPSLLRVSSGIIAHETAHQWWGDLLVWGTYRDQWVAEALADYSSLMFTESTDPKKFRAVLDRYRNDLLEKNKDGRQQMDAGPVTLGARLSSSQFPDGYTFSSYERGAWLFHMLRTMMQDAEATSAKSKNKHSHVTEDEAFVRALGKARQQFEGKAITTADLLKVFESELPPSLWHDGKKSLDWFYEGWVNGTAIPRFELEGVKYAPKDATVQVTGKIVEKDAPKGLVTPVPIYASIAGRSVLLGRVFVEDSETSFHLTAPAGTRKVVLDPEQTLLSRVH